MLLWMMRFVGAALNTAVCALIGFGFSQALRYNPNMRLWDTFAWVCSALLLIAASSAAVGLLVPRLLRFGLRWHTVVGMGAVASGVALMAHEVITCLYCARHIPWEFLWVAAGCAFVWSSVAVGIRALAVRGS